MEFGSCGPGGARARGACSLAKTNRTARDFVVNGMELRDAPKKEGCGWHSRFEGRRGCKHARPVLMQSCHVMESRFQVESFVLSG